jgi:hypothetical protein
MDVFVQRSGEALTILAYHANPRGRIHVGSVTDLGSQAAAVWDSHPRLNFNLFVNSRLQELDTPSADAQLASIIESYRIFDSTSEIQEYIS